MFWKQFLQRVLLNFVWFKKIVRFVRPLDPFVRAVCLWRTIFFVNAVRVSGLSLPSVRGMGRPSELSNRTIIINAANPATNLTTVMFCGVSSLPRLQGWHIQNRKQTRKQKWNLTTLESGGRRAGARKRVEAEGDNSNIKTVIKFVGRWTIFQTQLRAICTILALEMDSLPRNVKLTKLVQTHCKISFQNISKL